MPQILLIGYNGQIGWELQRTLAPLGPVTALDYPQIDFAESESIRHAVRQHRPDLIVNAAAYTDVDRAESDPERCRTINATAPAILAEEARRLGAGLVHYSTDYVFDGVKRAPYTEEDPPHPLNAYARAKLEGDHAIQASGVPHLILRSAWVYGLRGRNFLLTIRRLAREGAPLRIVDDQTGCPTWCRALAEATAAILGQVCGSRARVGLRDVSGLYNAVCAGETTWHGFARAFLPAALAVQPISTADYPTPARRPAYSVLDCGKLRRAFGVALPHWREALAQCLRDEGR